MIFDAATPRMKIARISDGLETLHRRPCSPIPVNETFADRVTVDRVLEMTQGFLGLRHPAQSPARDRRGGRRVAPLTYGQCTPGEPKRCGRENGRVLGAESGDGLDRDVGIAEAGERVRGIRQPVVGFRAATTERVLQQVNDRPDLLDAGPDLVYPIGCERSLGQATMKASELFGDESP